ncbi:MAG: hypothetical protein GX630_06005, partial [Actinobacteria bacterium]|nr:hypothetical protein [Actinomycetota bacterium]
WLYVCHPLRYYTHPRSFSDVHGYSQPTRFVSARVRHTMDLCTAADLVGGPTGPPDGPGTPGAQGPVTTDDIRRRLKEWL